MDDVCEEIAETVPEDSVMILDDVHLLPPPARDAVAALVDELPSAGHLAIAGRAPLPLPLARLRAGHLLELGEPDLALTLAESAGLLDAVGMRLGDQEIARPHEDVEGRAAGLILSAQAGGGEGRPQVEYLAEEVLMRQPPDVQRFLLETSILDRFDPPLAEAVTRRPDAGRVITDLVGRHLFTAVSATTRRASATTTSSRRSCAAACRTSPPTPSASSTGAPRRHSSPRARTSTP